jgi:hypothetical protein
MRHETHRRDAGRRGRTMLCIMLACISAGTPQAAVQQQNPKIMTEIQSDIRQIVGGHFTPDALSPEIHGAIESRAKARAKDYLDLFDSMYLGVNFDAITQSELYLPSFLELVMPAARERARTSAAALLRMYDAVLVVYDHAMEKPALLRLLPDETQRLIERLNVRRIELHTLLR